MEKVDVLPPQGVIAEHPGIGIVIAAGTSVPADGAIGYAPSALFIDDDASNDASRLFINHGTSASADFNILRYSLGGTIRLPLNGSESTDYLELGAHNGSAAFITAVGATSLTIQTDANAEMSISSTEITLASILNANAVGIRTRQALTDVHDTTPTDAQLDTAFGTPASLGRGFIGTVDDADGDTNGYIAWTSDASWYWLKGTKAL